MPIGKRSFRRAGLCAAVVACCASCETTEVLTPRIGSVEIAGTSVTLAIGETVTLGAVVRDRSSDLLEGRKVYWGSLDTTIVTVDSVSGVARARAPGTTRVAASSEDQHDWIDVVVPPGPPIAFNTIRVDTLGPLDDVDEFTFTRAMGQMVNVMLRGTSDRAAHQFRLRVISPAGNVLDSVTSRGTDTDPRGQAVAWLDLPEDGPYRVRVEGTLGGEKGSYTVLVDTIHPAPEKGSARVVANTVTSETITPGDIDVYEFEAGARREVSIIFHTGNGAAADALRLFLQGPGGTPLLYVQSNRDYTRSQGSGRLLLAQGSRYILRVQGVDATDQGPYSFQVHEVNRAPENEKVGVTDGVAVSETLLPQGDIDTFTLKLPAPREVNIYFWSNTGSATDTVKLRVLRPDSTVLDSVMSPGVSASLYDHAIGYLPLSAGTHRFRVDGSRNAYGSYQFLARSINLGPERGADTVGYGRRVNEAISVVGDVDQFRFSGKIGERVQIRFAATSGTASDTLRLSIIPADGTALDYISATLSQGVQTRTIVLPSTREYVVRVRGANARSVIAGYWFQLDKVN